MVTQEMENFVHKTTLEQKEGFKNKNTENDTGLDVFPCITIIKEEIQNDYCEFNKEDGVINTFELKIKSTLESKIKNEAQDGNDDYSKTESNREIEIINKSKSEDYEIVKVEVKPDIECTKYYSGTESEGESDYCVARVGPSYVNSILVTPNVDKTSSKKSNDRLNIVCSICNYRAAFHSALEAHIRTHTKEKPFSCSLCNYNANEKSQLKTHMRKHTGEKPYACPMCDHRATYKTNLMTHMRRHTGEKPFLCNLCPYKATQKSNLMRHMSKHGERPYGCTICSYKAGQKSHLIRHMNIHRRDGWIRRDEANSRNTL